MKNIIKYPTLIFFAAFIAVFTVVDLITPDRESSELENRTLAQQPKLTVSSLVNNEYTLEYETYTNDQFYLRDMWITLKSLSENMLGKIENNGIVYGDDGFMFEKANTPDYERIDKNIQYYSEFIELFPDLPITVAMIPSSYTVLSDKVPYGLNSIDEEEYMQKVLDSISGENVTEIDFTATLLEHKDEYIYYRTDHHWTTLGAYYAYEEYISSKGKEAVPLSEIDYTEVTDFLGTYYNKSKANNPQSDTITFYDIATSSVLINYEEKESMYNEEKLSTSDKYATFLHGNNGLTVIESAVYSSQENSKVLVIKDSFANCMVPFLLYNYDEVHVVDLRHFVGSLKLYLNENEFDDVLLMYNFKNFSEDINIPKLRY